MKERPILFSAPMVRAILDGSKTQTRRVVKHNLVVHNDKMGVFDHKGVNYRVNMRNGDRKTLTQFCPYGQPGDRLWVRETWRAIETASATIYDEDAGNTEADYKATPRDVFFDCPVKWKPSIHMPRWASRITLEITAVRVERVQDISEKDARAEGVNPYMAGVGIIDPPMFADEYQYRPDYCTGFQCAWDEINAKRGIEFSTNPWVWVIEFKRAVNA